MTENEKDRHKKKQRKFDDFNCDRCLFGRF